MPVRVSYPGVYIEEVPSGVRTIVGVGTSIAAFLGRAASGPPNEPVEVNGIGEFERLYGPVSLVWPLSLAVRDFFQNGGSRAIVVRLYKEAAGDGVAKPTVGDETKGLKLRAVSPGAWGADLRADVELLTPSDDLKKQLGLELEADEPLFNLTVRHPGRGVEERLGNLVITLRDHPRRVDKVLAAESRLVRWEGDWPTVQADLPQVNDKATDLVTAKEDVKHEDIAGKSKAVADGRKALIVAQAKLIEARAKFPESSPEVQAAKATLTTAEQTLTTAQQTLATAEGKVKEVRDKLGASNGDVLDKVAYLGDLDKKTGLFALEKADLFNLLCIPPDTQEGTTPKVVDPPKEVYQGL